MTEVSYIPGPLYEAGRISPTVLWNDSSDLDELAHSIRCGAVGATCNPVIAYTTILNNLEIWRPRIQEISARHPHWGEAEIGWQAVKDMSTDAAELLMPIFLSHNGRNGRLSVQTDPRLHRNPTALVEQALEFNALADNIIVKIPATHTGLEAIEEATAQGVCINVTVSFTVAQALQCAEAIERGLDRREAAGHDISGMNPVVTIMVGRLDDWLKTVVAREGTYIDASALEWAGIACFKRAYEIFQERAYRSRLLSAAFRNVNHWAELIGGDVVISPPFKWQQIIHQSDYAPTAKMGVPVNSHYLDELEQLEDFRRAYAPDGLAPAEFDTFGPTRVTLRQFLQAVESLDHLVRDVIVPAP